MMQSYPCRSNDRKVNLGLLVFMLTLAWYGFSVADVWAGSPLSASTNLLSRGSSFEAGLNGFQVTPMVRLEDWAIYQKPQIDTTTAVDGTHSLKIYNASGRDSVDVYSQAFRLNADENPRITLSLYAKAKVAGTKMRFSINNGFLRIAQRQVTLDTKWQRYHFTLRPSTWFYARSGVRNIFYVNIHLFPTGKKQTVWVDAIQMEKGDLTDYQNAWPVELGFTSDRWLKYYRPNQTPRIVLHASGPQIVKQKIQIEIQELLSGKKDAPLQLRLTPDGDQNHGSVNLPLKPRSRGSYRITARTLDGKALAYQGYAVIAFLGERPAGAKAFFGASISDFSPTTFGARTSDKDGPLTGPNDSLCSTGDPQQLLASARDLGLGWLHTYHEFAFRTIANQGPDTYVWKDSDLVAQWAKQHGLELYVNLAGHGGMDQPDWARTGGIGKGSGKWTGRDAGKALVDAQKFAAFTGAVVGRYKDRIKMWEVWNEPEIKMTPQEYAKIHIAAYRAAKAADPTSQIYGFSATKDLGGNVNDWIKANLELGMGDYIDGIAIHGYHVTDRHYVNQVRQLVQKMTGKVFPIVESETGGNNGSMYTQQLNSFLDSPSSDYIIMPPEAMVTHVANELACGAARQSWFDLHSVGVGIHRRSLGLFEYDGSPTPVFVAYNAFIDRVGLGHFVREVSLSDELVIYVFEVQGQGVAMLWSAADTQRLEIPLAADQLICENMAGVPQTVDSYSGGVRLVLDKRVQYLRGQNLTAQQLAQALSEAVLPDLQVVQMTRVGIVPVAKGQAALSVIVRGKSGQSQQGSVELVALPPGLITQTNRQTFKNLGLGQGQQLLFALKSNWANDYNQKIRLALDVLPGIMEKRLPLKVQTAQQVARPIQLDGDLSDWPEASLRSLSPWVKLATRWDAAGLWLAVKVQDATPRSYQEGNDLATWQSDCIELYFNPKIKQSIEASLKNIKSISRYLPGDFQVIASVRGENNSSDAVQVAGKPLSGAGIQNPQDKQAIRMVSQRNKKGYTAEICIPWTFFPEKMPSQKNILMGFSLAVRDVDLHNTDIKRFFWAGDNDNYFNTSGLGVLVFKP